MDPRYERQIHMDAIGEAGQQTLQRSRVLVVGAGGLGSPVLYYLCAAGVGTLGIVDADCVSISNLNRQILYTEKDVGVQKTQAAANRLRALNSSVQIQQYPAWLTHDNAAHICSGYDMVVDCVDNTQSRMLAAHTCNALQLPLVEGGIEGLFGFVLSTANGSACYGCLRGNSAAEEPQRAVPVLGATAGVVGCIQAAECIKLLLGKGEPLFNQMLYIDLQAQEYARIEVAKNPRCPVCGA